MSERNLSTQIQLALSKLKNVITWRNNTAMSWAGRVHARNAVKITLAEYHPIHAGLCKGSSDLIGITTVEITPEMVGKKIGVFTAIEVKMPGGRITPEQINFINAVNSAGGIAGIANDQAGAIELTKKFTR